MQLMPGQTVEVDYGTPDRSILLVRIDRHHDGITFTVTRPTHTTLGRTFLNDDFAGATAYMQYLHDAATAGQPVWLIEAGASALINASNALTQDAELIAAINDTMDAAKARLDADAAAQREQVADIIDGPRTWNAFRQAHTRTGRPTSQPMDNILDSAVDGYIPRGQGATSTQLIALHKRGKVVLDWQATGARRRIAGAWIAGRQPAVVAA